jgi:hypothetical protein
MWYCFRRLTRNNLDRKKENLYDNFAHAVLTTTMKKSVSLLYAQYEQCARV